jgi:predicted nucleic acid-binding protein
MVDWRAMAVGPETEPIFLDTAYVNALVNTRDEWHEAAVRWQEKLAATRRRLVTTEFVLVEIADGLSEVRFRLQAAGIISVLQQNPFVEIVPATSHLLTAALDLYRSRPDKDWGLTDCASFVVMGERALSVALTTDEHLRQAGFRVLLSEGTPELLYV